MQSSGLREPSAWVKVPETWFMPGIAADHLGHAQVSMTQDRYMARGRVHTEVAAMLDRVINDE